MSTKNFNRYAELYDLFNNEKDYRKEANVVDVLINKYAPMAQNIIEFGSGSGKHSKFLSEKGYFILGLERSAVMVEQAQTRQTDRFRCVEADISEVKFYGEFDVVLSLFHVFSYMTDELAVHGFLKNANSNLKLGGVLIFDFWFTSGVLSLKPENREKVKENNYLIAHRRATPHIDCVRNVVNVVYDFNIVYKSKRMKEYDFSETHPMRHFSIPEIRNYADKFGFEVLDTMSFSTLSLPTLEDWDCGVVLRKIGEVV